MKQKITWILLLIIGIVSSCNYDISYIFYTDYVYENTLSDAMTIECYNDAGEFEKQWIIPAGESLKFETSSSPHYDAENYLIEYNKVRFIFGNNEKEIWFEYDENNNSYNIFHLDNYAQTSIKVRHIQLTYSITQELVNLATPIE